MDEEVKEFFAGLSAEDTTPEAELTSVKADVEKSSPATTKKRSAAKKEAATEDADVTGSAAEPEEGEGQLTVDVYQTDDDIVVQSTIAGVDPDNLEVAISNEMVTVRGQRSQSEAIESKDYFVQELYWGRFSRSVILPQEIDTDKASAELENGVLTVRLPKVQKQRVKKLKIKTN